MSSTDISMVDMSHFQPARIMEIELSQPLPTIPIIHEKNGQAYHRAIVIVRVHTYVIGFVELTFTETGLTPAQCAEQIWQSLSEEINAHLKQDGLAPITHLEVTGIPALDAPPCQAERQAAIQAGVPITIIVAAVNRTDTLKTTLETLMAQEYPNFDILVVDNAPHLNIITPFIRENYSHIPQIRCVQEKNPGLASAHNRGLAEVTNPLIAITDDDVTVDRYWLAELAKGFAVSEKVGCVTGMIFAVEMEAAPQEWIEQYGGFNKGFSRRIFDLKENRVQSALYPYTAGVFGSGANMAFRTEAIRAVGGFDHALGAGSAAMGGDDLAAFFSIVTAGYQLVYEPSALLYHLHRRDYAGLRRQAYGYGVGLAAYLSSAMWHRPRLLLHFFSRVPLGVIYLLNPKSPKNAKKKADYPKELTTVERRGLLYGPFAYLKSLWRTRKWEKQIGPPR